MLNVLEPHEVYTRKINRQLAAHLKGKHTKLCVDNLDKRETNRRKYNISGFDFWGNPNKQGKAIPTNTSD